MYYDQFFTCTLVQCKLLSMKLPGWLNNCACPKCVIHVYMFVRSTTAIHDSLHCNFIIRKDGNHCSYMYTCTCTCKLFTFMGATSSYITASRKFPEILGNSGHLPKRLLIHHCTRGLGVHTLQLIWDCTA